MSNLQDVDPMRSHRALAAFRLAPEHTSQPLCASAAVAAVAEFAQVPGRGFGPDEMPGPFHDSSASRILKGVQGP